MRGCPPVRWFQLLSVFNESLKRIDMAGKPTNMSQIKQLLILQEQGKGIKTIARTIGISKNTVKVYCQKLDALSSKRDKPFTIQQLIHLPEPELEAIFHAGNPAYKDDRYTHLKGRISYYKSELKDAAFGIHATVWARSVSESLFLTTGAGHQCWRYRFPLRTTVAGVRARCLPLRDWHGILFHYD
jgi:hypothetical protein